MAEYNKAFFGALTNTFLLYKERHGEEAALDFMTKLMQRNLKAAYDAMGFKKGDPKEFASLMEERDGAVGLEVEMPDTSENRIVYRFLTDPFPNLKGNVDPQKLDSTYMDFKVSYLLGENWSWQTTKHIWRGDSYTEHIIERR